MGVIRTTNLLGDKIFRGRVDFDDHVNSRSGDAFAVAARIIFDEFLQEYDTGFVGKMDYKAGTNVNDRGRREVVAQLVVYNIERNEVIHTARKKTFIEKMRDFIQELAKKDLFIGRNKRDGVNDYCSKEDY